MKGDSPCSMGIHCRPLIVALFRQIFILRNIFIKSLCYVVIIIFFLLRVTSPHSAPAPP